MPISYSVFINNSRINLKKNNKTLQKPKFLDSHIPNKLYIIKSEKTLTAERIQSAVR